MRLSIRVAQTSDAAALMQILNPIIAHGGLTQMNQTFTLLEQETYLRSLEFPCFLLVATLPGGEIVGMQGLDPCKDGRECPHEAEISTFVHMSYQGRGVGRKLFERVSELARENGVQRLLASIRADNPAAVSFYKKLGFSNPKEAIEKEPLTQGGKSVVLLERWLVRLRSGRA